MDTARHACAAQKQPRPHGRKQYSKKVKGWVMTAICLLCVFGILNISGGIYISALFSKIQYDHDASDDTSFVPGVDDVIEGNVYDIPEIVKGASEVAQIPVQGNKSYLTNILLLGVDSPNPSYKGSRADCTIIMTINKKDKTIKLTSLMRDTLVTLPGIDWDRDGYDDYAKFNASFAYGGFDLLSKTIEQNFRLNIDQYIAVNFQAFSACVDIMGGLDMELSGGEARIVGCGSTDKLYHLTGAQALEYARIRNIGNDFERTARQRKVITELVSKAKNMSVGTLNNILMQVLPHVVTNMSTNELSGYALNALTYASYSMDQTFRLPEDGKFKSGPEYGLGSILVLTDPAEAVTHLQEFIYN